MMKGKKKKGENGEKGDKVKKTEKAIRGRTMTKSYRYSKGGKKIYIFPPICTVLVQGEKIFSKKKRGKYITLH